MKYLGRLSSWRSTIISILFDPVSVKDELGSPSPRLCCATPITISNIDIFSPVFVHPGSFDIAAADGYLEIFTAPGEHSFVKPHLGANRVEEAAEKRRLSDSCSDELHNFHSTATCLKLFSEVEDRDPASLQGGEYHVPPLYNTAVARGADIHHVVVPTAQIRFCVTADEYTALCAQPPFSPVEVAP